MRKGKSLRAASVAIEIRLRIGKRAITGQPLAKDLTVAGRLLAPLRPLLF